MASQTHVDIAQAIRKCVQTLWRIMMPTSRSVEESAIIAALRIPQDNGDLHQI